MKHNALIETGVVTDGMRGDPPRFCCSNKYTFSTPEKIEPRHFYFNQIQNGDYYNVYLGFKRYLL